MTPLSVARTEWEAGTTSYPLPHKQSYGEIIEEPYRRYGNAIAWLEWSDHCEIRKFQTLTPKSGEATLLLTFLKALATKHGIRIFGNPVVYEPTYPLPSETLLTQEQLMSWYRKQGFVVGRTKAGTGYLWYPDVPKNWLLPSG